MRAVALAPVLALAACFPAMPTSEQGTLVLPASGLFDPTSLNGGAFAGDVIAGTRLCPSVAHVEQGPQLADVGACFTSSIAGAAGVDADGCVTFGFDDADVTWTFTPIDPRPSGCAPPKDFVPAVDDFKFHSTTPAHAHLALFSRLDIAARTSLGGNVALVSPNVLPPGWGTAAALFADRQLRPTLGFVDDSGAIVEYVPGDATVSLAGHDAFLLDDNAATPLVEARAHGSVELALTIAGHTFAAPALSVDGIDDVASMEPVVFAFGEDANREKNGLPIVRAFVTDTHGRVVVGAPVSWKIEDGGDSAIVAPLSNLEGVDTAASLVEWVAVQDCKPPPPPSWFSSSEVRSLTLEARLDRFVADIPIRWRVENAKSDADRASFDPPQGCPPLDGSQGCASTSGAPMLIALAALGFMRRTTRKIANATTTIPT